jgi:hypothetical protein
MEFPILDRVETGSKIDADRWRGYARLRWLGYEHQTVNHAAGE